jgi:hypothetical protein
MVYDDDTYEPQHQNIERSDRRIVDIQNVPKEVQERISELKKLNPSWEPEDVFSQMLEDEYEVELDEIYAVLSAIGWAL